MDLQPAQLPAEEDPVPEEDSEGQGGRELGHAARGRPLCAAPANRPPARARRPAHNAPTFREETGRGSVISAVTAATEAESFVAAQTRAAADRRRQTPTDAAMGVNVNVEYWCLQICAQGYEPRYQELAANILKQAPGAEVIGQVGRSGTFEVTVNGELIFSKLECGGFPFAEDIIAEVKKAQGGEKVVKVTKSQAPCVIL
ncbi:unnamed protein product [Lampetra planeri]